MRTIRYIRRTALIAAAATGVALAGFAAFQPPAVSGQGDEAVLKAVLPTPEVKEGDERIPVEIRVEGATDMASVQFDLEFNPKIFQASENAEGFEFVQKGDFLASTGREVVCTSPITDAEAGIVRYTCVTLRLEPAGPDGEGLIATVFLDAKGSGETDLVLDRVAANVVGEETDPMPIVGQGLKIDVASSGSAINWMIWAPIIAVGALGLGGAVAFGASRMRAGGGKPAAAV